MVLKIELITASSVHQDFIRITKSCLRDGSANAHGNGYRDSHRLTTPASSATEMFSRRIMSSVFKALFSPTGLVLGRIGEMVVHVSSVCSSRRLHKHSIRALYVEISRRRVHTEVLETIHYHLVNENYRDGRIRRLTGFIRALLDTRKYSALSALFLVSVSLLATSLRSKSRVGPFVDRSEIIRRALNKGQLEHNMRCR